MENIPGFSQEHLDIHSKIGQQVFRDIPSFNGIWNPAIEAKTKIAPFDSIISKNLSGYIEALVLTCEQGLYAIHCLEGFSTHESSNITEFYVSYYLNDFIIRVKTGTDLLALIIKHIYKLNIDDTKCSIENGYFVGFLRKNKSISETIEPLAIEIDRIRCGWSELFDILRNIAIHQAGLKFIGTQDTGYPVSILLPLPKVVPRNTPFSYDPNNPLKTLIKYIDDEPIALFLVKINSKSLTKYPFAINPISFCEEVWKMWSSSTDKILNLCEKDLLAKLSDSC